MMQMPEKLSAREFINCFCLKQIERKVDCLPDFVFLTWR